MAAVSYRWERITIGIVAHTVDHVERAAPADVGRHRRLAVNEHVNVNVNVVGGRQALG
jgi:hypothetical protein